MKVNWHFQWDGWRKGSLCAKLVGKEEGLNLIKPNFYSTIIIRRGSLPTTARDNWGTDA